MGFVDFHSHVLPRADHGSSSVEMSISQLQMAEQYGIDRIIATPHYYPYKHTLEYFTRRREKAYKALAAAYTGPVQIRVAAEAQLCEGLENLVGIEKLFICGTNSLLLELPYGTLGDGHYRTVERLVSNGIDVILAHADRYPNEYIDKMLSQGARIQLNAQSFCTLFKRRELYTWMEDKKVVALGSDLHRLDKKAYPRFCRAIEKIGDNAEYIRAESDAIWNRSKQFT